MAEKKRTETKTVTRYTAGGSKVTVSEETAAKLGGNFSSAAPKS